MLGSARPRTLMLCHARLTGNSNSEPRVSFLWEEEACHYNWAPLSSGFSASLGPACFDAPFHYSQLK